MMTDYTPIDCGLYSEYELAVLHVVVRREQVVVVPSRVDAADLLGALAGDAAVVEHAVDQPLPQRHERHGQQHAREQRDGQRDGLRGPGDGAQAQRRPSADDCDPKHHAARLWHVA